MEGSNKIEKIRYTQSWFDPMEMVVGRKMVYELTPDGRVLTRMFLNNERKCSEHKIFGGLTEDDFRDLCMRIGSCIDNATGCSMYIDDTDATVRIYRAFGRVETMDRGLGSKDINVGDLIAGYIQDAEHKSRPA